MKTITNTLIALMFVATTALAQEESTTTTTAEKTTTATETASESTEAENTATDRPSYMNSEETRGAFLQVLDKYPPQVAKVLKLDPGLFTNAAYMANYPALAEFVARHPEVAHTPSFYLETIWINDRGPVSEGERIWERTMEGISILTVMMIVVGTLVWLIRTLIEHRRWSRLTRTQVEVHGKLLDRLQSNEDLLAYMQTAAGKRFLESAPIPLDAQQPRAVGAPINRILWSVQVGLILAMGGVGFRFVGSAVERTAAQPFVAMGTLAMAIGVGFLLSAFVSFFLSKRLGLFTGNAAETPAE